MRQMTARNTGILLLILFHHAAQPPPPPPSTPLPACTPPR